MHPKGVDPIQRPHASSINGSPETCKKEVFVRGEFEKRKKLFKGKKGNASRRPNCLGGDSTTFHQMGAKMGVRRESGAKAYSLTGRGGEGCRGHMGGWKSPRVGGQMCGLPEPHKPGGRSRQKWQVSKHRAGGEHKKKSVLQTA